MESVKEGFFPGGQGGWSGPGPHSAGAEVGGWRGMGSPAARWPSRL